MQGVPDLLRGLITCIPGVIDVDRHQRPESTIWMEGHEHARDQLELIEIDLLQSGLVLQVPQPR